MAMRDASSLGAIVVGCQQTTRELLRHLNHSAVTGWNERVWWRPLDQMMMRVWWRDERRFLEKWTALFGRNRGHFGFLGTGLWGLPLLCMGFCGSSVNIYLWIRVCNDYYHVQIFQWFKSTVWFWSFPACHCNGMIFLDVWFRPAFVYDFIRISL